jgi:hypothetical protein
VFLDELATGQQKLSAELLRNNDFLHAFDVTSQAALRTHRDERIRLFAQLLLHETPDVTGTQYEAELYEESLRVLEQLSVLDIKTLTMYVTPFSSRFATSFKPRGARFGVKSEIVGRGGEDRLHRLEGLGLLRREFKVDLKRDEIDPKAEWYFTALFWRLYGVIKDFPSDASAM